MPRARANTANATGSCLALDKEPAAGKENFPTDATGEGLKIREFGIRDKAPRLVTQLTENAVNDGAVGVCGISREQGTIYGLVEAAVHGECRGCYLIGQEAARTRHDRV
jgi:hypothetical protein